MKMECKFSSKKRVRDAVNDRQSLYRESNVKRLFLNLIYHLDNTSIPYCSFCSSSFDVST